MFDREAFGSHIRECRKRLGLTISECALALNITYQYLGEIEMGKRNPSIHLAIKLLNLLNTNFTDCLKGREIDQVKRIKVLFVLEMLEHFEIKDIEYLLEISNYLSDNG